MSKGFCIGGLNPKALLLFLALLPQFAQHDASWPTPLQLALLGLVQVCNCALVYSSVAMCSNAVLRTSPRTAKVIGRLSGAIMIPLAVGLMSGRFA